MSQHDVERFDRWAPRYERSLMQRIFFDRVHRAVLDLAAGLGEPGAVLDVGCGSGRLLRAAHRRWPRTRLFGVDPAPAMIEIARRLTPAELQVASAEALPLPDSEIDLALSTISFHHWADPAAALREIARVLRAGGHVIIADASGLPRWIPRVLGDRPYPTAAERVALFSASGLRVIEQRPVLSRFILATIATKDPG